MENGRAAGYMYLWEYRVRAECVPAFLRAYGAEGDWVRLFRQAPGYLRTELHRDLGDPARFVTIDYWESREALETFHGLVSVEWERLDARCAEWTLYERELGRFGPADPPAGP
jgi:hypothetical protein